MTKNQLAFAFKFMANLVALYLRLKHKSHVMVIEKNNALGNWYEVKWEG